MLSNFFGKVEEMNSNEAFLRDYILNQGWLDKDERAVEVEGAEGEPPAPPSPAKNLLQRCAVH